jgi:hypothetical protein
MYDFGKAQLERKQKIEKELPKRNWARIFCFVGLHRWHMYKEFMVWHCERCGEEKVEHY